MGAPPLTSQQLGRIFHDQIARIADDAAFLWVLRSVAVEQSYYFANDVAELERRVDAQLEALSTTSGQAWEICTAPSYRKEAGETFVLTMLAFQSNDVRKVQHAVTIGLSSDAAFRGLVSAMGWLPDHLVHPWLDKFLASNDLNHKYLAAAACSVRRDDPQEHLATFLKRADCIAHLELYARALRLAGELRRVELLPMIRDAARAEDRDVKFWALWSATLLGDKAATIALQPFVLEDGPHRLRAIHLCFRALPMTKARAWLNTLAKEPTNARVAIIATAVLGDPIAVEWLLGQMIVPASARLAGEAFTAITGIDLQSHDLILDKSARPSLADGNADFDDERLPFPDVHRVAAAWQSEQARFVAGQRYLMGDVIDADHMRRVFCSGNQRRRRDAALELSLLEPNRAVLNHAARSGSAL
jgi:uncharacterized protein (TIGR02270 family)